MMMMMITTKKEQRKKRNIFREEKKGRGVKSRDGEGKRDRGKRESERGGRAVRKKVHEVGEGANQEEKRKKNDGPEKTQTHRHPSRHKNNTTTQRYKELYELKITLAKRPKFKKFIPSYTHF
jgi:hypothetical protein